MKKNSCIRYYSLKLFSDLIVLLSVCLLTITYKFNSIVNLPPVLWAFFAIFFPVFIVFSYLRRDYMKKIPRDALDSFLSTVYTFLWSYLLTLFIMIFLVPSHPSRVVLGLFFVFGMTIVTIFRYLLHRFVKSHVIETPYRVLITGAGRVGKKIADKTTHLFGNQIDLVGFLDDNKEDEIRLDRSGDSLPVLGGLDDIRQVCDETSPDSLFISISNIKENRMLELMDTARAIGLPVKIISDVFDIVAQKVTGGSQEKFPVVEIEDTPVRSAQYVIKRTFDLIGATLLILLSSPILILSALLVKMTSKGPVFYRAKRLKNREETFAMLKFRTMYTEEYGQEGGMDDEKSRREQSIKDNPDPRITPVGRWLRRFSIDELPQLFNVLKGDMSLVGPRPPSVAEAEEYEDWHRKRLEGWPGITGLWQVSGRTNLDFEDMVLLDVYYIENWSLYLDFKILLKTIPAVLSGRGAN